MSEITITKFISVEAWTLNTATGEARRAAAGSMAVAPHLDADGAGDRSRAGKGLSQPY
jgi:hypothetical protein